MYNSTIPRLNSKGILTEEKFTIMLIITLFQIEKKNLETQIVTDMKLRMNKLWFIHEMEDNTTVKIKYNCFHQHG
jgi:hypothetical protein